MRATAVLSIALAAATAACGSKNGGPPPGPTEAEAELEALTAVACDGLEAKMVECAREAAGLARLPEDVESRIGEAAEMTCRRWREAGVAKVRAATEALGACAERPCAQFSECLRTSIAAAEEAAEQARLAAAAAPPDDVTEEPYEPDAPCEPDEPCEPYEPTESYDPYGYEPYEPVPEGPHEPGDPGERMVGTPPAAPQNP